MSYFKVQRIAKVSVDILSGFAVMGGSGQVTRAPAHPRTRAIVRGERLPDQNLVWRGLAWLRHVALRTSESTTNSTLN